MDLPTAQDLVELQCVIKLESSTKVWLFLLGLSVILMMVGYRLGGRPGLFIGFLLTVGFQMLLHYLGDSPLLDFLRAREILGQDAWGLRNSIAKQVKILQTPAPRLYVCEVTSPIAFSYNNRRGQGIVCLSIGLLQKLSAAELEAVLAHQLCHLRCLEQFRFRATHSVAFAFLGLGRLLDHLWMTNKYTSKARQPFSRLMSPVAWLVLRLAITDRTYFANDEMAAALLHDRKHLAEALWKLESYCQNNPLQLPPCSSHFFIVNPLRQRGKNQYILAHPKIDLRIKRLVGYFPI